MIRKGRLAPLVALALAIGMIMAGPAGADLESDLADVASDIGDLEAELAAAGAERSEAVAAVLQSRERLDRLIEELGAARATLTDVRRQRREAVELLDAIRSQLQRNTQLLAETTANMESSRTAAEQVVRSQYMTASGGDLVGLTMSVADLGDISAAETYLARVSRQKEASLDRYTALRNQQEQQRIAIKDHERQAAAQAAALADLVARADRARRDRADKVAAVEEELGRQRRLLRELDEEIEHFEGELAGLEEEQARLEKLLEEEQSAEDDDVQEPPDEDEGGDDRADDGAEADDGRLVRPVPGRITSGFGPRRHPILDIVKMHTGIDMEAKLGQRIVAAADGRVIHAGSYGGYGTTVIIDHGSGMATLYAHQSRLEVRYGDHVSAGQLIGEAGATGLATGPHLHFEVRMNRVPVDPVPYL